MGFIDDVLKGSDNKENEIPTLLGLVRPTFGEAIRGTLETVPRDKLQSIQINVENTNKGDKLSIVLDYRCQKSEF